MVGHLLQYHPIFIKLKEMISKNDFGELQYIYSNRMSFGKLRSFEDVIWSFAPHDISMMLALSKSEVDSVRAEKFYGLQENICDIATIHLTFKSGLRGHIQVSWLNPVKDNKLVVIGTKGMAIFDDTQEWNRKLKFLNHSIDLSKTTPIITKHDEDYIIVNESEPLKEECKHFIDLVNGKVQALTDGEEGLRVLNILSEASRYNKKNTNYDSK
jgi:predicted dehydrogenase